MPVRLALPGRTQASEPRSRRLHTLRLPRFNKGTRRPLREREVEQWKIDKPFARIVDNVDVQPPGSYYAADRCFSRILDCDA